MSRSMNTDSTESFRVIVTREARGRGIPERSKAIGPYSKRGLAKNAGEREVTDYDGVPLKGMSYRIQRTTTDWQDVE